MTGKPLAADVGLEWLRYMNRCNPDGDRTPLAARELRQVFAYVQLLEERLAEHGESVTGLRRHVGLDTGPRGKGMPSRAVVRARVRRIEARETRRKVETQRVSWRGTLPTYTARFERGAESPYVASIDEMPGVLSQGKTLAAAMASLAACVRLAVRVGTSSRKRSKNRKRVRR
jgi:hypothetical protein